MCAGSSARRLARMAAIDAIVVPGCSTTVKSAWQTYAVTDQ